MDGCPPIFDLIVKQHGLPNMFGMYFSNNPTEPTGGVLTLGGPVPDEYTKGDYHYTDVVDEQWYVVHGTFRAGTYSTSPDQKIVIDSGTSLIALPPQMYGDISTQFHVNQNCSNQGKLPKVSFTFSGKEFVLDTNDLILKITTLGQTECTLGIMPRKSHF